MKRACRSWRQTTGRDGKIYGSYAGSSEEVGSRFGFSLESCDDGQTPTPKMADNSDVNGFTKHLTNNSVLNNVHS